MEAQQLLLQLHRKIALAIEQGAINIKKDQLGPAGPQLGNKPVAKYQLGHTRRQAQLMVPLTADIKIITAGNMVAIHRLPHKRMQPR